MKYQVACGRVEDEHWAEKRTGKIVPSLWNNSKIFPTTPYLIYALVIPTQRPLHCMIGTSPTRGLTFLQLPSSSVQAPHVLENEMKLFKTTPWTGRE